MDVVGRRQKGVELARGERPTPGDFESGASGIAAVKGALEASAQKLIDAENADRKELYQVIAAEEKTTADKVAERNAQRNYVKAQKGYYFKMKSGEWKQPVINIAGDVEGGDERQDRLLGLRLAVMLYPAMRKANKVV